ncbi:MAG: ATP-binding protein [Candidatus Levybacteria bacterium]|nr:ATP-binding protein [Candidatus Levybacteria bacterium]
MNDKEPKRTLPRIEERIDPARMIDAVRHNYADAISAFMELIDNAVDERIEGKQLRINLGTKGNRLFVGSVGGNGLDYDGLTRFFTWGESAKRGQAGKIGRYGVGGKAAMGYLGNSMEVVCATPGSNKGLRVVDGDWTDRKPGELKVFQPSIVDVNRIIDKDPDEGLFNITIGKLQRKIDERTLYQRLGEVYRPLLISEHGEHPKVRIILNGADVKPMEIRYVTDDPELAPKAYDVDDTQENLTILTVGIKETGQNDLEPGIRCYANGRLIAKGKFFGIPSHIPGSRRLIGEAEMPFVPITTNKVDFDHDSREWKAAFVAIEKLLRDRWLEKLEKLQVEEGHLPSNEELNLARRLKTEFQDFLRNTRFLTNSDLAGTASGRLPPTKPGKPRPEPEGTHASPEGRTPPAIEALVGKDKVKRWGPFDDWIPSSLGNGRQRSDVIVENDREVLRINTDYAPYQYALRKGKEVLDLYFIETITDELSSRLKPNASSEEYRTYADEMLRRFIEYRQTRQGGVIYSRRKS